MTPTQRSLKKLRADGWLVAIVEKWNPHLKIRQDLWGFGDLLCIRDNQAAIIQTTSGSNVSSRLAKIQSNPFAQTWNASPNRSICIHGWAKRGARGKRKLWTCRELWIDTPASDTLQYDGDGDHY